MVFLLCGPESLTKLRHQLRGRGKITPQGLALEKGCLMPCGEGEGGVLTVYLWSLESRPPGFKRLQSVCTPNVTAEAKVVDISRLTRRLRT